MAETYTSMEDPRDWRGVPIVVGGTVIYGAPVGRSIAMVEGTVESFTKSGRVNVRVVRRAYGYSEMKQVVHVGQDRVTVVTAMPDPLMPTEAEKDAAHAAEQAERDRLTATHDFPVPVHERTSWGALHLTWPPCTKCGADRYEAGLRECAS